MRSSRLTTPDDQSGFNPHSFVALMYHNICTDDQAYRQLSPSATSYFVGGRAFAEQMFLLAASVRHCLSSKRVRDFYEVPAFCQSATDGSDRGVLLTFDDGWAGAVEAGGPILERHGFQALLFVTTDFLNRPYFLSRSDLTRLDPRLFHVGSHARTHRMLSLLSPPEIRAELCDSKKLLEDACGYQIDSLSVPSGAVDARVRGIAQECGYRFIFDSEIRVNRRGSSPMSIGRIPVMRDTSMTSYRRYLQQRVSRERLRRSALHVPKQVLGLRRYEKLRRRLLGETAGQLVSHET